MADINDRTGLLFGKQPGIRQNQPPEVYVDNQHSPPVRILQLSLMVVAIAMVLISFGLSIYRSAFVPNGLYVMLGLGLIGFLALQLVLMLFFKKGDLSPDKNWFVFVVVGALVLESIFTDILLFN